MANSKKASIAVIAVLTTGMLALSGCSEKKNEIVFWNPFTGDDGAIMQSIVKQFNDTNPEYKIKNVALAGDDMYTKIPTVVNSGKSIPDFGIVHFNRIPLFAQNNIIVPVDEVIKGQSNISENNYIRDAWSFGDIDGKRYSVPLDLHGVIGYYNKDLLAKYAPDALDDNVITLSEVLEMGEKAKQDGVYAFGGASFTSEQFFAYIAQYSGDIVKDDKPTIDTPEAREAIDVMKQIYQSGYSTVIGDDNYSMFAGGKEIFTPEGNWTATGLKKDYPQLNWGLTNMLSVTDGTKLNWMTSHQFVVYNNPKENADTKVKKDKVIGDFLEFIRQHSDQWAEAGHIPASLAAADSDSFKALPQSFFVGSDEEKNSLKLTDYKYYGYVSDAVNTTLQDILTDKISVDEGLAKAQKEVEDKIAAVESGAAE